MDSSVVIDLHTAPAQAAILATFFTLYTSTLVFVPRSASVTRLIVSLAMAALTYPFCAAIVAAVPASGPLLAITVILMWLACLSGAEAVFVSRVDAAQLRDVTGAKADEAGAATLAWRALCLFFNVRRLNTRWESPGVRRCRPVETSRPRFVASTLARCAVCYLLLDLAGLAPAPEAHLITPDKQTLWRPWNLSAEDVVFRFTSSLGVWVIGCAFQTFLAGIAALAAVLLGLSAPEAWPPGFTSLREMTSLRAFWGTFWHQTLRHAVSAWADYLSDDVAGLPRGTLVSRYTRLFLAFFFSGTLHRPQDFIVAADNLGLSSPTWFSMQALGIMVEDGLTALLKPLPIPRPVRSFFGYFSTVAWFWWVTPLWMYPVFRKGHVGSYVPFSVVEWALGYM